jgi:hypothetical protein
MFCSQCGREIDSESKFCSYCGKRIRIPLNESKGDAILPFEPVKIDKKKPFLKRNIGNHPAAILFVIIFFLFVYYIFSSNMSWNWPDDNSKYDKLLREANAIDKLISEANALATTSIDRHTKELRQFIVSHKSGCKPFAEEITSLYGTWRSVKSHLPGTDPDGHKKYVQETFAKHIFSDQELGSAFRIAIEGSVKDIDGIQNDLAVKIRQEIIDRPLNQHEITVTQDQFRNIINKMESAANRDTAMTAGYLAASEIAVNILVRLGIQAGILTVGAANFWWNLGTSIIISLIVDAIWNWIDDPVGDIEREINNTLDKMANDSTREINSELYQVLAKKKVLWNETTRQFVEGSK